MDPRFRLAVIRRIRSSALIEALGGCRDGCPETTRSAVAVGPGVAEFCDAGRASPTSTKRGLAARSLEGFAALKRLGLEGPSGIWGWSVPNPVRSISSIPRDVGDGLHDSVTSELHRPSAPVDGSAGRRIRGRWRHRRRGNPRRCSSRGRRRIRHSRVELRTDSGCTDQRGGLRSSSQLRVQP